MRSRAEAEALDAADPLAAFRARFVIGDEDLIYLDGNSLGRLPVATRDRLNAMVDQWGSELVGGWDTGWLEAPLRAGDLIAPIIGVPAGHRRRHGLRDGQPLQAGAGRPPRGGRSSCSAARSPPTATSPPASAR